MGEGEPTRRFGRVGLREARTDGLQCWRGHAAAFMSGRIAAGTEQQSDAVL